MSYELNVFYVSLLGCCFSESTLAGIRLEIDGTDRGSRTMKIESTLSELEQLLRINNDPIEFMCQVRIGIFCHSYKLFLDKGQVIKND